MVTITLNGKKHACPSCYEELKTRHYQRMISEWDMEKPIVDRDFFKLFCILTDTQFTSLHSTAENEVTIWNAIRWTIEQHFEFRDDMPKVLQIGDKILDLPRNVGSLSIGQNIHLRQILDKSKYLEENLSIATAIYLQPYYDNTKFDFDRAVELEKIIAEMPAYLIKPVGFFILTNALTPGKTRGINWLRTLISHIKMRRKMLLIWLSGNGSHLLRTLG